MKERKFYIRLLKEEKHDDGIHVIPDDKCAVFDHAELDEIIRQLHIREKKLKVLRANAILHNVMMSENAIEEHNVPFKIVKFVEKKC